MSLSGSARFVHQTPWHGDLPGDARAERSLAGQASLEDSQRALLNILEDFAAEKCGLEGGQRAVLNILEDFDAEKARLEGAQRAFLNILEDSVAERTQLEATQRSVLNILEDSAEEKTHFQSTQRAVLNILDDFGEEKARIESTQRAVLNILDDFSAEKVQLEETQRAVLNILDDFDLEKSKVEQVNQNLEREIEDRKRVEEEIQRVNRELVASNKELEAFSYSVSHDLRSPLRGIDGFSLALLEGYANLLDERGKEYLRRVRAATQRMGSLIDDLLNLSRMTRAEIQRQLVDFSALALSVAAELKRLNAERVVELVIEPGMETSADPRLLRVILENLLGNAWKFTSSHSTAKIEVGQTQESGALAYFVRDDGAGFDPAYANRLFGAFQRLHSSAEFPGTGVGLATVQRIVQRHGGRIWAQGAVERGATFCFTLDPSKEA